MKSAKARKNVKHVAVASILIGTFILLVSIFFYLVYVRHFEIAFADVTNDKHAQAIILDSVDVIKDFVTIILPVCGIMMLTAGYYMLHYLRKEREDFESNERS